jgi:DNA-nicking Smr family endonuclease
LSVNENDGLYHPFSDLLEFVKQKNIPLREHDNVESLSFSEGITNEFPSFIKAMSGVRILHQSEKRIEKKPERRYHYPHETDDIRTLIEKTLQRRTFNVTNLPEYMEGYVEGTNPIVLEKLRSGEFSIQQTLDLHGCAIEEAGKLFEEFILTAVKAGLSCVRVIHGRGLKSRGEPVLKERLKTWILKAMYRKWILAFSSSRMCDGGPGATCILLRNRPRKKRLHIIG